MARFNANEFNRKIREAQRQAEQQFKRQVDAVNRANKKAVDDYNRKATAHVARRLRIELRRHPVLRGRIP